MPRARLDLMLEAAISFYRLDQRSDAELLARFLDDRDETAFEALLVRHTPAVRAACRGWLRSPAALVAVGLAGYGIGQWVSASDGPGNGRRFLGDEVGPRLSKDKEPGDPLAIPGGKDAARADETRPAATGRRREAVIRLPVGTFVKEVDAAPYGHGRLTWN